MGDAVVHFEIAGSDGARLGEFYGGLFGWRAEPVETSGGAYRIVETDAEGINGGIGSFPGVAPYVTFYAQVADLEASIARARSLGGEQVMAPREVSSGLHAALISDPDGNMVGMISAAPESPGR